jgi:hypothetical protein
VLEVDAVRSVRSFSTRRSIARIGIWRRGLFCRFQSGNRRFWAATPWLSQEGSRSFHAERGEEEGQEGIQQRVSR